jgi:hypothetical protein
VAVTRFDGRVTPTKAIGGAAAVMTWKLYMPTIVLWPWTPNEYQNRKLGLGHGSFLKNPKKKMAF